MKQSLRFLLTILGSAILCVSAYAQITTSSLSGRITDKDGQPVVGAAVVATHVPSGTVYGVITNSDGRYTSNGMRSGGPYTVEISCLGYQTVRYTDVTLQLAEVTSINASVADDAELLSEAIVISEAASKFASEKTGAATNITNEQMTTMPTISRSITDVAKLSPYGGNGMSFAGSDGRTANFTVDGANFNNNFGLNENLPGGGSPISIDAIEEVQVVISPYDVRQSNFIGGGVNAITKSGTNTFKGSAYVYHRNENMRGNQVAGLEVSGARDKDRTTTYGFTLGGPIIKNKLFFFANFEHSIVPSIVNRWRASEDGKANADAYISRTKKADMQTVKDYVMRKYGYDTGSYTEYPATKSNMKVLARLDWNITNNHRLAVRYNYTLNRSWSSTNGSSSDAKQRATQNRFSQYSMAFANSLYSTDNIVHTISADLNSRFSNDLSNQFLATFSILDDVRGTNSDKFPFIDILDGTGTYTPYMALGYELFTWNNGVHNRVFTLKDDVTYFLGSHKIMAGLSYEYQMADNAYMRNGTGYYRYNSLDDFLNERAPETVCITYGYDGELNPAARVRFHRPTIYAQDEWTVNDRFKLTYGLRLETIFFDNQDMMTNNAIKALDYNGYHVDTGKWPTPKVQVSPRVGFNWDILGDKSLVLRGGTGLFTGRLPLVFFTNMPTNSNMVQMGAKIQAGNELLQKFASEANGGEWGMVTDVNKLISLINGADSKKYPTSISPADGTVGSDFAAVDPKFKMPQVWKSSIAIDYTFPVPFPMSISGEFIYNKTVTTYCMKDINMMDTAGFARLSGADNRHVFPAKYTYTGTNAYLLTNTSKGYGWNASATFKISPVKGLDITATYAHNVSKELTGMPGSNATSAFTYVPTTEGPNNPVLHNSQYVTPDRFFASLTYSDKGNNHFSLFYETWRGGANYSYMYDNDLNGDNYNYDAIYIPSDADMKAAFADPAGNNRIRFKSEDDARRFWDYVNGDKYLSKNKGKYAEAYSVYSPWVHRLDFRYSHDFKFRIGKQVNTIQLNVDIKNILNLFNSKWGVAKYMNPSLKEGRILKMEKIDNEGYPVFSTPDAVSKSTPTWKYSTGIGQCWYAQVGIKYMFN